MTAATTALGQDIPDPNPRPNAWGSQTYYCGDDTQFSSINATINGAVAGDEIVVTDGIYVEALNVNTPMLQIRPETTYAGVIANGATAAVWQTPTFWNPTEGPDANNDAAITIGANTNNTYIGRPREFRKLASGNIVPNRVPVGNAAATREWASVNDSSNNGATYQNICGGNDGGANNGPINFATQERAAAGDGRTLQGHYTDGGAAGNAINIAMSTFTFWSRSHDKVAILSNDGKATISWCTITAQNGFGGGAMCTGSDNNTQFVRCTFENMWADGDLLNGVPVTAISCSGGAPVFSGCVVRTNFGGAHTGIIHSGTGAMPTFSNCYIASNSSPISDGIMVVNSGASAFMNNCTFDTNLSRYGTIFFDSSTTADADAMLVTSCLFNANSTIDGQYGATIHANDAVANRAPMVAFDGCSFMNANAAGTDQGWAWFTKDVHTNYMPECRILNDLSNGLLVTGASAGASAEEPEGIFADLSGDGVVNGADLALLLGAWN